MLNKNLFSLDKEELDARIKAREEDIAQARIESMEFLEKYLDVDNMDPMTYVVNVVDGAKERLTNKKRQSRVNKIKH